MTKIDKFAKGEMAEGQEKKYIESLYEKHYDEKLKEKYTELLSDKHGLKRDEDSFKNAPKKNTKMRSLILGAISVAAVFVLGFFLLPMINGGDQISSQQMAFNMITVEKKDVKRGGQENSQLNLDFTTAFNAGQYENAIKLYSSVDNKSDEQNYWLGLSYLYSGDLKNAKSSFSNITNTDDFKFQAELEWYKALNFLLLEENNSAKPLLENVASTPWKKEEAKKLLERISK